MTKIKFLRISFDKPLMSYQIKYFRASVIEATKRRSDLFHNHKKGEGFLYRYPLIQYKIIDKRPSIICINAGTDDIHYLLENRKFEFNIAGDIYDYEIEELNLKYFNIQTWDNSFRYNILNYMPFNQDNFRVYQKLGSVKKQIEFIEEMLTKHLMILLEELSADQPVSLNAAVSQLKSEKFIEYKSVFHQTYCMNFETNVTLPNYIGIGKGIASGFGIIKQLSNGKK